MRSRRKSSGNLPSGEIKRKERLITKSGEIMTGNYQLVYYDAENVELIGKLCVQIQKFVSS